MDRETGLLAQDPASLFSGLAPLVRSTRSSGRRQVTRAGAGCASAGVPVSPARCRSVVLVVQAPEGAEQRFDLLRFFDEAGLAPSPHPTPLRSTDRSPRRSGPAGNPPRRPGCSAGDSGPGSPVCRANGAERLYAFKAKIAIGYFVRRKDTLTAANHEESLETSGLRQYEGPFYLYLHPGKVAPRNAAAHAVSEVASTCWRRAENCREERSSS